MSLKVIVYRIQDHHRSRVICDAMFEGIDRCGDTVTSRFEQEYTGIEGDVAVFYGLEGRLSRIFREYSEKARVVYVDLGYWKRKEPKNRFGGYHKIVVNSRHPTEYFQKVSHQGDRAETVGVQVKPWVSEGRHILLAGMGNKGAAAEGFAFEEWERWAINEIRKYTRRPIIYRPKPSDKRARPIAGVGFSPRTMDVMHVLRDCHAVVTHHSNVAVDGLVHGIPAFAWKGVAVPMALQDLSRIEERYFPENRQQWVNDIAWTQWNTIEMKRGEAWKYLKSEGLL